MSYDIDVTASHSSQPPLEGNFPRRRHRSKKIGRHRRHRSKSMGLLRPGQPASLIHLDLIFSLSTVFLAATLEFVSPCWYHKGCKTASNLQIV